MFGTGMGIIGLVAAIAVDYESGNFSIENYYSPGTIGVVLSIIARMIPGKSGNSGGKAGLVEGPADEEE